MAAFTFILASVLVFAQLGANPLWDDEANTALFAKSIVRHGDTNALVDDNVIAFQSGAELVNLRNRYLPPLPSFIAAPAIAALGETSFAARLPFAILGWLTLALLIAWGRASPLFCLGIVTNASLFMFLRQCRYYAPALFCSVIIVWVYERLGRATKAQYALAVIASIALFASHYVCYVALYVVLAVDYLAWRRTRFNWRAILIPQWCVAGVLVYFFNPLAKKTPLAGAHDLSTWIVGKAHLYSRMLRDIDLAGFGPVLLIFIAPLFWRKHPLLRRLPIAILLYVLVQTLLAPELAADPLRYSPIRFCVPVIPALIALAAVFFAQFPRVGFFLGAVVLAGRGPDGTVLNVREWRHRPIPILSYALELISPRRSSLAVTIDWINQNVARGESVLVSPLPYVYPLMFHAPHAVYAWQLDRRTPQFASLAEIHFKGVRPPNYLVAFGPFDRRVQSLADLSEPLGARYVKWATLPELWWDGTRPEFFWHLSTPHPPFAEQSEAIYVYRRTTPDDTYVTAQPDATRRLSDEARAGEPLLVLFRPASFRL